MSEFNFLKPVKKKIDTMASEKIIMIKTFFFLENLFGLTAMNIKNNNRQSINATSEIVSAIICLSIVEVLVKIACNEQGFLEVGK